MSAPEECIEVVQALPDGERDDYLACCYGAAFSIDMERCTCWEPVYDVEQVQPAVDGATPAARRSMCQDCAYRPDSPERSADQVWACAAAEPGDLPYVPTGERFWCHQGLRRVVAWEHAETGVRVEARGSGYYRPPIIGLVPAKADGTPADTCAGWAAHRKAAAT